VQNLNTDNMLRAYINQPSFWSSLASKPCSNCGHDASPHECPAYNVSNREEFAYAPVTKENAGGRGNNQKKWAAFVEEKKRTYALQVLDILNKFRPGSKHPDPLLATVEFAHTNRDATVECLKQKVMGNLLLQFTKVHIEGQQVIKKYDSIQTYFDRLKSLTLRSPKKSTSRPRASNSLLVAEELSDSE